MSDLTITPTEYELVSGSINFTGLGSGTDFSSIVEQLVEIESINKTRLETWKATWEAKMESMTTLNDRMLSLDEVAAGMDTSEEFMARKATTSDSTVVSAIGTNKAKNGAYSITVGENVKHVVQATGVDSASSLVMSSLAAGESESLIIRINGTEYATAALDNTTTLTGLRDALATAVGSAATVEIVDDETASGAFRLQITSATGGSAGTIEVVQNPTDLSLDDHNVALQRYDDSLWSGTSKVTVGGQFTGDAANGAVQNYVFTIDTTGASATVGTDAFTINWTCSADSTSGSITVAADYQAGDYLTVAKGVSIQLAAGTVTDGDQFYVNGYANDIDQAEASSWTGPAITMSGNYLGTVNKTYSCAVVSGGSLDTGSTRVIRWTDSLGNTGTVSVSESNKAYEIEEGVYLAFAAGDDLVSGETFTVNVFSATKQAGQNSGLAQVAKAVHEGFSDSTTTAVTTAAATFSYTYAGKQVTVDVSAGMTLSQLINVINSDSDNPGVTASVINDGQGLPTSYKLVLTGDESGAANQITAISHTFTGSSFASGNELGGGFEVSQQATNSMIKVDGFPADVDEYLQRDSNAIGDVITGVAVELHDVGTATITISTDTTSILSAIQEFVDAVNYVQDYIRQETYYDENGEETGTLIGNYAYYMMKSDIDSMLYSSIDGLNSEEDTYTLLSQIGITSDPDQDGMWVIDTTTLSEALTADADAVANLFIANTDKGTVGVASRMYDYMEAQTDSDTGMVSVLLANYQTIVDNIDTKIASEEDRLALYQERLEERFARLETTLSELNATSKAIESQIESLSSSSDD